MKKIISFITIFLVVLLISTSIFAETVSKEKTVMELVENNTCTINITDNAKFEKKLTNYDLEKKELTISLTITNNAVMPLDKPSEIVFLIDNSKSMLENSMPDNSTRMSAVANSAKLLATELLKSDLVKISVVSFSTVDNGDKMPGDSGYIQEGTMADAKLRTALTNTKTTVLSAIDEVANDATGIRTDIEAGLTLAEDQFSGEVENKIIILLTDGVPNISLGSNAILYSGQTATNTMAALTRITNSGIQIISMMTGVTDDPNPQTGDTYQDLAEEIFGTPELPKYGKFYFITDDKIEKTVSQNILNDLKAPTGDILTDIDIYDYFPQEIVDNFNFKCVNAPTNGTVSQDIDLQNNRIVWHIDTLSYGQSATLSYKLTLKDNVDSAVMNKILKTNEEVDITTANVLENGQKKVLKSEVSPKIKLTLKEEPKEEEPKKQDTTVSKDPIPQTGATISFYVIIGISLLVATFFGIKSYRIK